jgi:hypothetical protein
MFVFSTKLMLNGPSGESCLELSPDPGAEGETIMQPAVDF